MPVTTATHTAAVPLAAVPLVRDVERRADPALFDQLWADPATRVLVMNGDKALLRPAGDEGLGRTLSLRPVDEVTSALTRVYLGTTRGGPTWSAGTPVVLEVVTDAAAAALEPDRSAWQGLRESARSLGEADIAVFAEALAIANWHRDARYCPTCGMPTVVEQGGWVRRCFSEDTLHFPRMNPAVILVITDDAGRLLLGHNTAWPERRFSLLAGFVEPGETFEAAAMREVYEESGVRIERPTYIASQPWPFPASVMIAMSAKAETGSDPDALRPDGEEIGQLRWFTRPGLAAAAGSDVLLPGPESIARRLIESWLQEAAGPARPR